MSLQRTGGPAIPVVIYDSSGNIVSSFNGGSATIAGPLGRRADAASVSAALSTEDVAILNALATAAQIGEVAASPTANTVLDRIKTLATLLAGGLPAALDTGALKASLYAKSAAAGDTVLNARVPANGDALLAGLIVNAAQRAYNGATLDLVTGNQEVTLLASAARTGATASADQTNYNARGAIIVLNVTAASGTGGLTLAIQGKDPVSGTYYQLNIAPTTVTNISTRVYTCYVGANTAGAGITQNTSEPLPRTWRINVAVGDSSSYTYSVGAALIL